MFMGQIFFEKLMSRRKRQVKLRKKMNPYLLWLFPLVRTAWPGREAELIKNSFGGGETPCKRNWKKYLALVTHPERRKAFGFITLYQKFLRYGKCCYQKI